MSSLEENKTGSDFANTAASDFYTAQPFVPSRPISVPKEPSSIQSLQQQISKIRQTLIVSRQLFERLESNEELLKYVAEVQEELEVVRARANNQLGNVKLCFEKNFGSLERELGAFKKSWKQVKMQAQAQIEEQISLFKTDINKSQSTLTKLFNSTTADLKARTLNLSQQIKQTKKLRNNSTSSLMAAIEQARGRLQTVTQNERKRRTEYERIVLGLLDRTVDQGERIMRRIC